MLIAIYVVIGPWKWKAEIHPFRFVRAPGSPSLFANSRGLGSWIAWSAQSPVAAVGAVRVNGYGSWLSLTHPPGCHWPSSQLLHSPSRGVEARAAGGLSPWDPWQLGVGTQPPRGEGGRTHHICQDKIKMKSFRSHHSQMLYYAHLSRLVSVLFLSAICICQKVTLQMSESSVGGSILLDR